MVWDERTDQGTIEAVIVALAAAGFNPVKDEAEETGLTIEIPLEKVSVGNLTKLLDAKGELIKKALASRISALNLRKIVSPSPGSRSCPLPKRSKPTRISSQPM